MTYKNPTLYFRTAEEAIAYNALFGRNDGEALLAAGKIKVGEPPLMPGQKAVLMEGGRYAVESPFDTTTATFCRECAAPMFIQSDGVSHHVGDAADGIDHDADADHVAVADPEPDHRDYEEQTAAWLAEGELKDYIVPVFYTGMGNFAVKARNPEHAKALARLAFKDGRPEVHCGNESEEIERIGEPEEANG